MEMLPTSDPSKDLNVFDRDSDTIISPLRTAQNTGREKDFSALDLNQVEARRRVFESRIKEAFGVTDQQLEQSISSVDTTMKKLTKMNTGLSWEYLQNWMFDRHQTRDVTIDYLIKQDRGWFAKKLLPNPVRKMNKDMKETYLRKVYELGVVNAGMGYALRDRQDSRQLDEVKVQEIIDSGDFGNLDRYSMSQTYGYQDQVKGYQ